jgi:2-desacetyl-2-hydroxyethyl bacteriochlorophyllide A dehydrogenase
VILIKAFVLSGIKKIEIGERERPVPLAHEVLIRVEAVGLCGTDFKLYRGEYGDAYPLIPGHELAGTIEEVGEGVKSFQAGARVTVIPNIPCGSCSYCLEGMKNQCPNRTAVGITRDGAYADYVVVPAASVCPIGDLPAPVATFIEPLACVLRGVERVQVKAGQKVMILGTGTTAHLYAQILKGQGCDCIVVGRRQSKLSWFREHGLETVSTAQHPLEEIAKAYGEKVDVLIDAIGMPAWVEALVPVLRRGGKILVFGVAQGEICFNYFDIYRKELQILGSFSLIDKFPQAIALLRNKTVVVDHLITHQGKLTDLKKILEEGKSDDMLKFVVLLGKE